MRKPTQLWGRRCEGALPGQRLRKAPVSAEIGAPTGDDRRVQQQPQIRHPRRGGNRPENLIEFGLVPELACLEDRRQIVRSPVEDSKGHSVETEIAIEVLALAIAGDGLQKFPKTACSRAAANLLAYLVDALF